MFRWYTSLSKSTKLCDNPYLIIVSYTEDRILAISSVYSVDVCLVVGVSHCQPRDLAVWLVVQCLVSATVPPLSVLTPVSGSQR